MGQVGDISATATPLEEVAMRVQVQGKLFKLWVHKIYTERHLTTLVLATDLSKYFFFRFVWQTSPTANG